MPLATRRYVLDIFPVDVLKNTTSPQRIEVAWCLQVCSFYLGNAGSLNVITAWYRFPFDPRWSYHGRTFCADARLCASHWSVFDTVALIQPTDIPGKGVGDLTKLNIPAGDGTLFHTQNTLRAYEEFIRWRRVGSSWCRRKWYHCYSSFTCMSLIVSQGTQLAASCSRALLDHSPRFMNGRCVSPLPSTITTLNSIT